MTDDAPKLDSSTPPKKDEPTWISSLPFPKHWLYYIALKLVLLGAAIYITLRIYKLV